MSNQTMIPIIAEYFKTQPVLKAWLFGSYARGEETPESDVDIIVEFDHSSPIGLFTYAQIWRELQERLGVDVDLVEEGTLKSFAVDSANRDKKLVYERAN
ncbi:MAG: nucleotidyltransferase family protein [Bacteroidales bacterium]|nr:nucleotidyltransferase family protein [Bacteroidales bacterium]MBP5613648.1 nucleotidyltransferase family protein [Bacteroidales bacterium]MBR4491028.1 nucleotidyltransferase family protein [Bacteroidales bacterium]MBR4512077.1 nucleotidyltransferase family protein [Bacteroidales bacterium]